MEVLEERDGYRVVLEQEQYPDEPYNEGASPLLQIDSSLRSAGGAVHVDAGKWDRSAVDEAVERAAARLFEKYRNIVAKQILGRYLHAFWGVTKIVIYDSGASLYLTYDPGAWREQTGAPAGRGVRRLPGREVRGGAASAGKEGGQAVMVQPQFLGFQMRLHEGTWRIYLIRVGSRKIPEATQRAVFGDRNMSRVQAVCDALNNGLLAAVTVAVKAAGREVPA